MNNSSPAEAYVPSMMSFAGLESSIHKQLWDWETNAQAATNTTTPTTASNHIPLLASTPFLDYPSILPMSNFPFYSPVPEYPTTGFIKREEDHSSGQLGLNLGQRTYFSSGDASAIDRLFRRTRGLYQVTNQVTRCQVEGCKADLSGAKHYHRRHKVCEFHSKATVVVAGGMQQRFCQQCSRFHVLSEFDEAKRSCRKRLADHNRRRRKPQPQKTTDSSVPKSPTSSPMEESTQTTRKATRDICTASKGTSNISTIGNISTVNTSLESQGDYQNKANHSRSNGPSLSLGGAGVVEKGGFGSDTSYHHQQQNFSSSSSSSTSCLFHSHNFFCSSSHEASHSTTGGGSDQTNHQSNLLHLGQSMFEVMDLM